MDSVHSEIRKGAHDTAAACDVHPSRSPYPGRHPGFNWIHGGLMTPDAPRVARLSGRFGCALTVDVEEWYHTCLVPGYVHPEARPPLSHELDWLLPELLDMLAEDGCTATFFVLGEVAEAQP